MSPSYTPDKLQLAARIRDARVRVKKSQERIAAEVGTTRRHWIRWENGEHRPTPEFMARIASATGVDESFFSDEEEEDSLHPLAQELFRVVRQIARSEAVA
jgi:transcriptional regulator with XRE-family HTH domain